MDISAKARSYPLQDALDFKDVFYIYFGRVVLYCWLYERVLLYKVFIRRIYVVNFNVSSTKDNAHAKLSRYV